VGGLGGADHLKTGKRGRISYKMESLPLSEKRVNSSESQLFWAALEITRFKLEAGGVGHT